MAVRSHARSLMNVRLWLRKPSRHVSAWDTAPRTCIKQSIRSYDPFQKSLASREVLRPQYVRYQPLLFRMSLRLCESLGFSFCEAFLHDSAFTHPLSQWQCVGIPTISVSFHGHHQRRLRLREMFLRQETRCVWCKRCRRRSECFTCVILHTLR